MNHLTGGGDTQQCTGGGPALFPSMFASALAGGAAGQGGLGPADSCSAPPNGTDLGDDGLANFVGKSESESASASLQGGPAAGSAGVSAFLEGYRHLLGFLCLLVSSNFLVFWLVSRRHQRRQELKGETLRAELEKAEENAKRERKGRTKAEMRLRAILQSSAPANLAAPAVPLRGLPSARGSSLVGKIGYVTTAGTTIAGSTSFSSSLSTATPSTSAPASPGGDSSRDGEAEQDLQDTDGSPQRAHPGAKQEPSNKRYTQPTDPTYTFRPIGFMESSYGHRCGAPRQSNLLEKSRSRLTLIKDLNGAACLDGLWAPGEPKTDPKTQGQGQAPEKVLGYSHLWVVYVFHQNTNLAREDKVVSGRGKTGKVPPFQGLVTKISPPRMPQLKVGVLACRTPHRPNPIGLSLGRVVAVESSGGRASVVLEGLDLLDGTPVLDVKPYLPEFESLPRSIAHVPWL